MSGGSGERPMSAISKAWCRGYGQPDGKRCMRSSARLRRPRPFDGMTGNEGWRGPPTPRRVGNGAGPRCFIRLGLELLQGWRCRILSAPLIPPMLALCAVPELPVVITTPLLPACLVLDLPVCHAGAFCPSLQHRYPCATGCPPNCQAAQATVI